ncbi:MAG: lon3 [Acidimicrobiales bacterium]|nr:lon3 [Acidimicrobiales bacterium]
MADLATLTLPVLPLSSGVVLPQMVLTVALETAEAKAAAAAAGDRGELLLVPRLDGHYASVGVIARIESGGTLPNGTPALVIRAVQRARVGTGVVGAGDALWLTAEPVVDEEPTEHALTLARELRATLRVVTEHLGSRRLSELFATVDDPAQLADAAGWWPDLAIERKVELLETVDLTERLEKVLAWAKEALADLELQERIRTDVSEGMEKSQREFLLRQQMAAIRKELGEDDDSEDGADAYRTRFAELGDALPADVRSAVDRELGRLERTSPQAMEHGWIRTWLDTVLDVPWGTRTDDHLELEAARAVLDADHTGLDEVKERIIEFLAVRRLRAERGLDDARRAPLSDAEGSEPADDVTALPSTRRHGAIITLVGPPGVGKTSLGESVARALGRKFVRVALGGVRDEAEIRGHRRTYVGAQPGRIVRALAEAGTMNPVFLLDEVDKVGADWRGDPSSALLEVLDPAQNHGFRDHYLEVDLDLSDVLFIATANVLDTIPAALLDRMEIVRLDGYTDDEKVGIAEGHLLARQIERNGLRPEEVAVDRDALRRIVEEHTREAGVRTLERQIGKLLRKVAVRVAGGEPTPVSVGPDDVTGYLGRAVFPPEPADRTSVPGVATGLAVTGAGGDVLFVEATAMPAAEGGKASLTVTGQLGDVMKESAQIALSYVRSHAEALGVTEAATQRAIHVHFPAGAVPKDGPSAGITMTTALVSLLTGRNVRPEVGMTGEVTLQGKVLPIGGVKQKVLAAHRAGLTEVILPARNGPDLDDVPEPVRTAMTFHLVSDVAEVVRLALDTPERAEVVVGQAA